MMLCLVPNILVMLSLVSFTGLASVLVEEPGGVEVYKS